MVGYRIHGGLGNQIFQILTALRVSTDYKTRINLDFSNLSERDSHVDFWMNQLSRFEYITISAPTKFKLEHRELRHISELGTRLKVDKKSDFDFHGWQPEICVFEDSNLIRRGHFLFDMTKTEIYPMKRAAIHLRRGDYLVSPNLGLVTNNYLGKALHRVIDKGVRNFTVFSDDLNFAREWAESSASKSIRFEVFEEKSAVNALSEMSKYSLIITSNSTFSFWASYFSGGFSYVPFPFYNNVPRFDRNLHVSKHFSRHIIDTPRLIPAYISYLRQSLVNMLGRS